ncbi:YcgN family cysteine cluster protein [Phaeovibrio sulfidiphilus]|uniref:UPF0260 protein IHV25_09770 n=1 Tax=Phaeovibrio sulfidiphilus TaxID=1220600 RepID=A0A8J6YQF7_9PROT|nr:YcgN family cysteine cluster protein [Phaeovibrio sulfidiphilus]MBE1237929.1 YcgN family cysteine cluster protein [Phaeovibrio sulfidiphilus]
MSDALLPRGTDAGTPASDGSAKNRTSGPDTRATEPNPAPAGPSPRFWETKALRDMTDAEWESLCDHCGKCCLHKLQHEETGEIFYTNVACHLLDLKTGQCSDYANRWKTVPDCIKLTADKLETIAWLPSTCAYRLLADGNPLPPWHPLETGTQRSVRKAKVSVRGRTISEHDAGPLDEHIVNWDDL